MNDVVKNLVLWIVIAVGLLSVLAAVLGKAHREETYLRARFPEYAGYAERTGRFVPRFGAA